MLIKRKISITLAATLVAVQVLGYGGANLVSAEGASNAVNVSTSSSYIANGKFEADLDQGKIPNWTTSSNAFELTEDVGSKSGKTLKLTSDDADEATTIQSDRVDVLPNRSQTVTVAVYLEDPPMSGAFIDVEYYNGDDVIAGNHKKSITGTAAQWNDITITSKAPSDASSMKVVLGSDSNTTGIVYFDDVRVEQEADLLAWAVTPVQDVPAGSDFELSVKATEGVKVTLSEGDNELDSVTGNGETPVKLHVADVQAGTHNYKITLEGSSAIPLAVPVTAHALTGIQVTKDPVYLKAIAGEEEYSVVTKAVYGPLTVDISPYTALEIAPDVTSIKVEGQKVIALEEGNTVVKATYQNKLTQFHVTVLADDAEYPEQKTLKEVGIELPTTSIQVNSTVTARVYGNYENANNEIEKVYLNAQHVLMNSNPSNIISFDGFTIKGLNEGETVVKAVYNGESSAGVTIKVTAPATNPGGGGGGWGGGVIIPPTPPVTSEGRQEATKEQLALKDGKATIKLEAGKYELLLPAGAHDLLGEGILQVVRDEATLEISAAVLKDMLKSYDASAAATARILITLKAVDQDTVAIDLAVLNQDGTIPPYTSFTKGVKLLLPIPAGKAADLLGVYSVGANSSAAYVGGNRSGSMLIGNLTQPGQYEIQTRDKQFRDVSVSHWGYEAIRTLYAKHIVLGVNDTDYRPAQAITRAEFVTIVARAYELKTPDSYTSRFNDVRSDTWYSDAVAAAVSSGVVRGVSSTQFAPNALITREEMAVMLVRASGISFSESSGFVNLNFKDSAKVKPWAKDAVRIAAEQGWVHGKDNNRFDPQAQASRAEMAQMIYNIFKDNYK